MLKKSTIIKIAATAGLVSAFALGAEYTNQNVFTSQIVEASRKYKIKLTHNAYIYNYRGKRRGRRVLKKGKIYTSFRTKKIHHKNYYYLGHHNYIKVANAKKYKKAKKTKCLFKVEVKNWANTYVKPMGGLSSQTLYGKRSVYKIQKVNGETWYNIGKNKWVKAAETNYNPDTKTNNFNSTARTNQNDSKSVRPNSKQTETQNTYSDRGIKKLNAQEVQQIKNRFLLDVNNWRQKQGLKPYQTTDWINDGSQLRSDESIPLFIKNEEISHTRPNGEHFWTAFSNPENANGEVAAWFNYQDESTKELGDEAFEALAFRDAGHRRELAWNYSKPIMGIGISSIIKDGEAYMIIYADMGNGTN